MKLYKVPGLSIAVIENYKIAWAKEYGVIETGSSTPVSPKTLFQAGSISKPVRRRERFTSSNTASWHR